MKETQGRRLIAALKRTPMTSMQLQMLGVSTCWWKRVRESLTEKENLIECLPRKPVGGRSIKVYAVVPK